MTLPFEICAQLVQDEGGGEAFLEDVGSMLQRMASRDEVVLQLVKSTSDSRVLRSAAAQAVPHRLVRELGAHRAQRIPPGDSIGRITTSKVVISISPVEQTPASETIIKTYNYPLGRVVTHATGAIAALEDVLNGHV